MQHLVLALCKLFAAAVKPLLASGHLSACSAGTLLARLLAGTQAQHPIAEVLAATL
jgi:hypothetical protein